MQIISPVGVQSQARGRLARRRERLEDSVVMLLSNNKNGTEGIFAGVERALQEGGVGDIRHASKPVASVAQPDLDKVAASCDVAVLALGD